jgi:hypothetical protein
MRSLLTAAALGVSLVRPIAAQTTEPVTIGLLRSDGLAIPFAHWDSTGWTTLPTDSIPWLAHHIKRWYLGGSGARRLAGGSLVKPLDGYDGWAQVTDFSPRRIDDVGYPISRVGMVLTRPARVIRLQPAEKKHALTTRLTSMIRAEFDRRDSATVRRSMTGNNLSAGERTRLPMRFAKLELSRERVNETRIYFFVAERDYPGCETGALEGFAVEKDGDLRLVGPRFDLGDCDGKGRTRLTIYGLLPQREGVFLVGEESQWEAVTRVILELKSDAIRRVVPQR